MALQIFSRCPSCAQNFAQLWCQSTCSPVHSKFINVTGTKKDQGAEHVTSVEYHVTNRFVYGLYNSCRNVQYPGTNQPALAMTCGTSMDRCTVDVWLTFMGSTSNPQVPFAIAFHHYADNDTYPSGITPQNASIVPCNQAPNNQSSACSCQDCEASCSAVQPYPAHDEGMEGFLDF